MNIFEAQSYVEFLAYQLKQSNSNIKKHGSIKLLADRVRCHPTFISQVIHGKSHLNQDQALICCKYFQLTDDETAFFINLVDYERCGNVESKNYFQTIIEKKRIDRKVFYKRANLKKILQDSQELLYLSHWSIPVIHAALQLPNCQNPEQLKIATDLKIDTVKKALNILKKLNLARENNGSWEVIEETFHIPKTSPAVANFHSQWRLKTAAKLIQTERVQDDLHYSSLFAISEKTAEQIRELLLNDLQDIRKKMETSTQPSHLYALIVDFYPIC